MPGLRVRLVSSQVFDCEDRLYFIPRGTTGRVVALSAPKGLRVRVLVLWDRVVIHPEGEDYAETRDAIEHEVAHDLLEYAEEEPVES